MEHFISGNFTVIIQIIEPESPFEFIIKIATRGDRERLKKFVEFNCTRFITIEDIKNKPELNNLDKFIKI